MVMEWFLVVSIAVFNCYELPLQFCFIIETVYLGSASHVIPARNCLPPTIAILACYVSKRKFRFMCLKVSYTGNDLHILEFIVFRCQQNLDNP